MAEFENAVTITELQLFKPRSSFTREPRDVVARHGRGQFHHAPQHPAPCQ